MALAFPFAVLGNLARMLLIVLAAERGGQEAGNFVHENMICSLIPYIPAIVGLLFSLAVTNFDKLFRGGQQDIAKMFVTQSMQAPLNVYRIHMGDFPSTAPACSG